MGYIEGTKKNNVVLLGTYSNINQGSYNGITGKDVTVNVSQYNNYKNFTQNNFIIECISGAGTVWVNNDDYEDVCSFTVSKSYNASTGVLTVSNTYKSGAGAYRHSAGITNFKVYLINY